MKETKSMITCRTSPSLSMTYSIVIVLSSLPMQTDVLLLIHSEY